MRYFGGKQRISKDIVTILENIRRGGQPYLEPFLGGGSVFTLMGNPKIGSDVIPELIEFWQAIQNGWVPPSNVSREEYQAAKDGLITGPLRAFMGFGCSFGGKWFGGYAATEGRNYATNAKNSTLRKKAGFEGAEIILKDFFTWDVSDHLIYCDPPYAGKTLPGIRNNFDTGLFWDHVRYLSENNTVVVSEVTAPDDFVRIWERSVKTDMQQANRKRVECLFVLDNERFWGIL